MVVFRLIGLLFIIAALMALGSDALLSLEEGAIKMRSFSEFWILVNQGSHDWCAGWVDSGAPEGLVDPLKTALSYPSWAVLGVIGVVLAGLLALLRRAD